MKFSIIIPFRKLDDYTKEAVDGILKQRYKDYELILLPDEKIENIWKNKRIKIIKTGAVRPARKRNIGARNSKGEILAFVDSDAVAREDWLENSLMYFKNKYIGAVGGPNMTPRDANLWEYVSGDILGSFACGMASVRYNEYSNEKEVNELPSCNLLVRKDVFKKLGGFDESLLTAEDSKLCFDIKEKLGLKVVYSPRVLVYHHRRNSLGGHLKQMWIYGRDIAWLIKKEFKLWKLYYGTPTLFVVFGIPAGAVLAYYLDWFKIIYFIGISAYILFILLGALGSSIKRFPLVFIGLFLTHLVYGLGFLYGLFTRRRDVLNVR